jgi:hypothetical protein
MSNCPNGRVLLDFSLRIHSMTNRFLCLGLLCACCLTVPSARAEFRSAKDMQKECRVALKVMNGTAEKNSDKYPVRWRMRWLHPRCG